MIDDPQINVFPINRPPVENPIYLKDYLYNWTTLGIFGKMHTLYDNTLLFFKEGVFDPTVLDALYMTVHSGNKVASPLVEYYYKAGNGSQPYVLLGLVATLVQLFGEKWNKLYSTVSVQIDALNDIDITETVQREESAESIESYSSDTSSGGTTESTGSNVTTYDSTTKTQNTAQSDYNDAIFAFNSDVKAPTSKRDSINVNLSTQERLGDDTVSNTSSTNTETTAETNATSNKDTNIGVEQTTKRIGTSGSRTKQELIKQQREMLLYNFYKQMFNDMDSVLTIPVYI